MKKERKQKIHVLVIAELFPPDMGGGATRALNVVKGLLSSDKCRTTIIAAVPHYPHGKIPRKYLWKPLIIEQREKYRIIRTFVPPLQSKGLFNRIIIFVSFIISALLALPIVRDIDVIWAANPNILSFFPAYVFSIVYKVPIVLNVDDLWPEELYNLKLVNSRSLIFLFAEKIAKKVYNKASFITPISPAYILMISKRYNIGKNKIKYIPAGVDTTLFNKYNIRKNKNKTIKITYIGAFSIAYDFDQVIEAAKILEEYSDISFLLQGDGEQIVHIKQKIKKLGVKNIRVVQMIVPRKKVAKILQESDILLLPLKETGKPYLGISSKIYEYQAAGKPIICCARGMPAIYIRKTKSGIVVSPGNPKNLANAIRSLKKNSSIALTLGKNGKEYVMKNVSLTAIGQQFYNIFLEIINEYKGIRS